MIKIRSILTSYDKDLTKTVYKATNSYQINEAGFTSSLSVIPNTTWINNHLKISATPLSQVTIVFGTNIIKRFNQTTKSFVTGATFKLIINFREC